MVKLNDHFHRLWTSDDYIFHKSIHFCIALLLQLMPFANGSKSGKKTRKKCSVPAFRFSSIQKKLQFMPNLPTYIFLVHVYLKSKCRDSKHELFFSSSYSFCHTIYQLNVVSDKFDFFFCHTEKNDILSAK